MAAQKISQTILQKILQPRKCCIHTNKTRPCNLQQTIDHYPEPNIRNKFCCYYPLKNFQNGGQVTLKKNSETENKYFLR